MDDRVKKSLKWLGIDERAMTPVADQIYAKLTEIARRDHRCVETFELTNWFKPSHVRHGLEKLRRQGRVARISKGKWVPLL